MTTPLCKISFCVNQSQQKEDYPTLATNQSPHCIQVYPGANTCDLATLMGKKLGCGYQELIQLQIRNELLKILQEGTSSFNSMSEQEMWKSQMEKILMIKNEIDGSSQTSISPVCSQKRFQTKYFQLNYNKFFKSKSEKNIITGNKENSLGIYERSMAKKKQTQHKISMIKKNKMNEEIVQCTFTPNISNTLEFFSKKNPKFFNPESKDSGKQSTFARLYKNSFDVQEKRNKRLRTLQNEEETKISELSFVPAINECSRQICKMKSYASFLSELSSVQEQPNPKAVQFKKQNLQKNQHTVKKAKAKQCTFQPIISQNTKKLTKNLPGFYERLQLSKEKNRPKQSSKYLNVKDLEPSSKVNKLKLKKQLYTIDDGSPDSDQLQTQKKVKSPMIFLESEATSEKQKRSHELFNNRKKTILEAIVAYFLILPHIPPDKFSKNQKKYLKKVPQDSEITACNIQQNPYIPEPVKQILEPIISELKEAEMSLNKQQFLWALEKLFEELTLPDKGSLLGWGVKLLPQCQ